MRVFIGGSIAIKNLDCAARDELEKYINSEFEILIGDAYGIDSLVQRYFKDNGYGNITVYASGGRARNNIGCWRIRAVEVPSNMSGRDFYTQKDIAMTDDCDFGFMIWNGKSKGTLANIKRLTEYGKRVKVYLPEKRQMQAFDNYDDYIRLVSEN